MHIIVVSDRMATARSITLSSSHVALFALLLIGLIVSASSVFSLLTLKHLPELRLPFVQDMLIRLRQEDTRRAEEFLRQNVEVMAHKLGEIQARMVRLDMLGERLSRLTGLREDRPAGTQTAGRGGPLVTSADPSGAENLRRRLDEVARRVEDQGDELGLIESRLLDREAEDMVLPSVLPADAPWDSSFGWRADPITGQRAMHTGVDFNAQTGAPIRAVAGGIVTAAERHPEYGMYVDIDHGNGLTTRYAHASRLFVRRGALVRPGDRIAAVGSTGRSTGAHLHFEIRLNDNPQNPARFLKRVGPALARTDR